MTRMSRCTSSDRRAVRDVWRFERCATVPSTFSLQKRAGQRHEHRSSFLTSCSVGLGVRPHSSEADQTLAWLIRTHGKLVKFANVCSPLWHSKEPTERVYAFLYVTWCDDVRHVCALADELSFCVCVCVCVSRRHTTLQRNITLPRSLREIPLNHALAVWPLAIAAGADPDASRPGMWDAILEQLGFGPRGCSPDRVAVSHTPLMTVCKFVKDSAEATNLVQMLLDAGADVNVAYVDPGDTFGMRSEHTSMLFLVVVAASCCSALSHMCQFTARLRDCPEHDPSARWIARRRRVPTRN